MFVSLRGNSSVIAQARKMEPALATRTMANEAPCRTGKPITRVAATDNTGLINGATNMAPITTAAEFASSPKSAIRTARDCKTAKR